MNIVFNLARRVSLVGGALVFAAILPAVALANERPSLTTHPATVLAAQPSAPSTVEQLNLSQQQKQKMRTIRKTRNQAISKVLNATQRNKLVQSLRSGTKLGAALKTLNLSANQKQQIGTIVQKTNQEIKAALTPKQQQQLEAVRKQHQTAAQSPIE